MVQIAATNHRPAAALAGRLATACALLALAALVAMLAPAASQASHLPEPPQLEDPALEVPDLEDPDEDEPGPGISEPTQPDLSSTLRVSTSGSDSERLKTIPISKRRGQKQRSVISLSPQQLGGLRSGDRLEATAELEVSVTCLERMAKCVGRIYHFSPEVRAKLVLASGPGSSRGKAISGWERLRCSQKLPHRNHHCVIVLAEGGVGIPDASKLPCSPGSCHVNLVLDASHRKAKRGHKLVVGVDGDDGVVHDKGRVNAAVYRAGLLSVLPKAQITARDSGRRISRLPVGPRTSSGKRVVAHSLRLDNLRAGEQLIVGAKMRSKIGHLPYNTLVHSQLILSESPDSTSMKGLSRKVAKEGAEVTEKNGFNCTQGRSGHPNPCTVKKVGVLRIVRDDARNRPLYLNLVVGTAAVYGGKWRSSHKARVLDGGYVSAKRFPARLGS